MDHLDSDSAWRSLGVDAELFLDLMSQVGHDTLVEDDATDGHHQAEQDQHDPDQDVVFGTNNGPDHGQAIPADQQQGHDFVTHHL